MSSRLLCGPAVKRILMFQRTNRSERIPFLFAPCCAKDRFGAIAGYQRFQKNRRAFQSARLFRYFPDLFLLGQGKDYFIKFPCVGEMIRDTVFITYRCSRINTHIKGLWVYNRDIVHRTTRTSLTRILSGLHHHDYRSSA
jgi:hypothetical protein